LMTGLHPHQVGIGHMTAPPNKPLGITGPYQGFLNGQCTTLAEVLKSAGYHTLMSGKWHLGLENQSEWPLQRGFDKFYGALSGSFNYFKPGGDHGFTEGNQPVETDENFYATDTLTDKAIEYVEQVTQADDHPFFLYLSYNAPHWPLQPKWEDYQKYRGKYRTGWQPMMQKRFAKQVAMGMFSSDTQPAPHVGPKWESLSEQQQDDLDKIQAAYAGCVDSIDQNIGKLVSYLKQSDQFENTLIFFLSDNGACQEGGKLGKYQEGWIKNPPLETTAGVRQGMAWANASNTPFRLYKHFVHEGGACTPLIAHWPAKIAKKNQGKFVRQVGYLPDFMATCVELSGAQYPQNIPSCQGVSLTPLLDDTQTPIHKEPIFWEHEGNAAMRDGNWKLVMQYRKPWELYDLSKDRTEMTNLADTYPEKRNEMLVRWEDWAKANQVAYPVRFNMYEFLNKNSSRAKLKNPKRGQNFVSLFDGKTLKGWKASENESSWSVEDGKLVCKGPRSHLFFVGDEKPFVNFHFKAEVMTTPGSNAGIYFHTRFQDSGWPKYGYECQVNISHKDPKKTSSLYGVENVSDPPAADNQWYTQEIIVRGNRIVLKVDGKKMVDYTEPEDKQAFSKKFERRLGKGTFALQAHDPDSVVYFRNLQVKRLK
ncbi:MAG: family 16 glycoside hydrolase, partial [Planctomycetota bacterium]